jgi:hypothetical protein
MIPTDSNARLATITLEHLNFTLSIPWQPTETGHIARWRRRDTLATLVLEKSRLTVAITSASDFSLPCHAPPGARQVVQMLNDAGVVFVAKPEVAL